jgi:L-lactate dehydrogenase complex protein LldG
LNAINDSAEEKIRINSSQTATMLEPVHKAYIKASIGVAENGAVWIKESQMINRLLPFICQHLVIVLEKEQIVSTMHHAYQQINTFEEGFGVFLAGPSKTADIEQSLVIGAHGARSLTVYLIN